MKAFNVLKWGTVWISTWTMLMSPVALGVEAKRVSKQQIQVVMEQLGLNKQITLGEFYKKNKHLFPPRIQKEVQPFMSAFKNQLMPKIEVTSSKSTMGEEIPSIRVSQGSELINIQWFGESEKMFKFQNTNISEIDVINFSDMFVRILAGDEKFRKQTQAKSAAKSVANPKYPDISKAEWQSMTAYDRANYVVNLRQLWQDAREVLRAKAALKKNSKTSDYFIEKNKYFFELFFGQKVEAAKKVVLAGKTTNNNGASAGESCIVAGYVAKYESSRGGQVCTHKVIDSAYANKDNSLYLKAKEVCASNPGKPIACNPYVFGTPNGVPTCVTPSLASQSFQQATHWDGPCDSMSRLSKTEISLVKSNKKQGRYEDGNRIKSDAEIKELTNTEQGAENYKLTEDYLLGILKFRGKVNSDTQSLFDKDVITDEILEQIKLDKKAFDSEIFEATQSCKLESNASKLSKRNHESNYWQACDQLHRRYLFVNELFASKCGKGDTYNPETLKCTCALPAPGAPVISPNPSLPSPVPSQTLPVVEVCPGAKCPIVNPNPVTKPSEKQADEDSTSDDCESKYPGASDLTNNCLCSSGNAPKKDMTDEATGQESWSCESTAAAPTLNSKNECGFFCKLWKGIKIAAPFVIGGILAFAIFKQLAPKKPALKAPPDICPNGGPAPCAQICASPKKNQSNGTCGCDGCPPGQTANQSTCFCATGANNSTQIFTCQDGATTVTNLDNCPAYTCWNGQSYENPMNCPPQTTPNSSPTGTGQ